MSQDSFSSKAAKILDQRRGRGRFHQSPLEIKKILEEQVLLPKRYEILELSNFLAKHYGNLGWHMPIPEVLIDIIPKVLADQKANTILDPWAGLGALLAEVQHATSAERCIAYCPNKEECELAEVVFPEAKWSFGRTLGLLTDLDRFIDVIASILPFNVATRESVVLEDNSGSRVTLKDSLSNLIIAASTARLAESGMGIFVVPPSFFLSTNSVLKRFPDLGFSVEAAFGLPPGVFAPHALIPTYLLVVRKRSNRQMFVAQLTNDPKTNSQVLTNYHRGQEGGAVDLGRYVDALDFQGLDPLRARENFEAASKRIGFPAVDLKDLTTAINLGRFGDEFQFPFADNAVYIPMIGHSDVVTSLDDLILKPQNYAQVAIAREKSDATFIAQFLNSELGIKIREWGKTGNTIPKLTKKSIQSLRIIVPELKFQKKILDVEARLSSEENTLLSLQNDLLELRRELWRSPRSAENVSERLAHFSTRISGELKEEANLRLDQWFETIPFPLASILRAWQASPSEDYKTKHEHLLHFFEATAQFISVILLSAYISNEALYAVHKEKLNETLAKHKLSFQRATFGTWKFVVEYLGKQTRLLLQENGRKQEDVGRDREICASIFADSTLKLPMCLSSKEIAEILATTNKMRNDWSGHGGVVGQEQAKHRNEQLIGQVERLRHAMSDVWETSLVVNALHCRPRKGLFENEIAILKGSNSEFLKESRAMTTWLDVDSLYIINGIHATALKLLPLIQVSASPETAKNACYFFNRTEREGARFVSYHFAGKPELSGEFLDVASTIRFLSEN